MHQITTLNMLHKTEERERERDEKPLRRAWDTRFLPLFQPPPYDVIYILRRRSSGGGGGCSSVSFISDAGENTQIIACGGGGGKELLKIGSAAAPPPPLRLVICKWRPQKIVAERSGGALDRGRRSRSRSAL